METKSNCFNHEFIQYFLSFVTLLCVFFISFSFQITEFRFRKTSGESVLEQFEHVALIYDRSKHIPK